MTSLLPFSQAMHWFAVSEPVIDFGDLGGLAYIHASDEEATRVGRLTHTEKVVDNIYLHFKLFLDMVPVVNDCFFVSAKSNNDKTRKTN